MIEHIPFMSNHIKLLIFEQKYVYIQKLFLELSKNLTDHIKI